MNNTTVKYQTASSGMSGAKGFSDLEHRDEPDRTATQCAAARLSGPSRIHQAAKRERSLRFNNLLSHITEERLLKAYQQLNKRSAKGIDNESWQSYGKNVSQKLADLHYRIHNLKYKPQPVKRIYIPKANGDKRPIGITTVEDKIVQHAMVNILEAIYEADFLGFSYGFRPKRNQHQALDAVYIAITRKKVSWVLDADISQFFDCIDHQWLMKMLSHRISDKRMLNLIEQTLKAGVVDDGRYTKTEVGTPQGAVISPLLGNIYLYYALDLWAHQWRNRHARGDCYIVRYADDSVFCFQYKSDGVNFEKALAARLSKFKLAINQNKTQLIEFGRFALKNRNEKGKGKAQTFDFLGFTHYCSTRRCDGKFRLGRKTIAKKMKAKLANIKQTLIRNINQDVYKQGRWLCKVVSGFYNYYAIPENGTSLDRFKTAVGKLWLKNLRRRSQKSKINWHKFTKLVRRFLPKVVTVHPYPNERFGV